MKSHHLGKQGEAFAVEFLLKQGYKILQKNYRTRMGEIDIIADDHGTIAFIEVKTRQEKGWDAFEAVSPLKQKKMIRSATQYLVTTFGCEDVSSRFDVLAVWAGPDGTLRGDLMKEAFFIS